MRDIWFVDSGDADAFHLYPDCPALNQAVQPIVAEQVTGLARVVRTERFGDLRPCVRCSQRVDAEFGSDSWEDRLESSLASGSDAFFTLLGEEVPTAAMLRGDEPLRVFKQNFETLRVFTDRLEIDRPALLGGEDSLLPYSQIRELRAVTWIPVLRQPAIEIDIDIDGEILSDRFELDIRDSPQRLLDAIDELIVSDNARCAESAPDDDRPPDRHIGGMSAASVASRGSDPEELGGDAPPSSRRGGSSDERQELARLYEEAQELGGSIIDQASGADLTKTPMSGKGFAQFVMDGCDSPEERKNLAERLDEAVRFARFMAEANANPLTNPKRWAKLVVAIGGCDADIDMVPTDGPVAGGGGVGGGGGSKPGPLGPLPRSEEGGADGAEPTDEQWKWLKQRFPRMKRDEIRVTGSRGHYNCLGFALRVNDRVWMPGVESITRAELDGLCAENGWVESADGDVEMVIWGRSKDEILHVSKVLPDGRNESKFGWSGYQAIHNQDDLLGSTLYRNITIVGRKRGTLTPRP